LAWLAGGMAMARERRCELLAVAPPAELVALADRCLDYEGASLDIRSGPTVGTVALEVREPVMGERFILGDVLLTTVEVEWRGKRSWAGLLGRDRAAALAAAVCDAEAEAGGPLAREVEKLCLTTGHAAEEAACREESELARTVVQFEELL